MHSSYKSIDSNIAPLNSVQKFRIRVLGLSRGAKRFAMVMADTVGYAFCAYASAWLLLGQPLLQPGIIYLCAVAVLVSIPLTRLMGFYRSVVR